MSFKVVSYNIHRAMSSFRRRAIKEEIYQTLAHTKADILCLQEDINTNDVSESDLALACQEHWRNSVYQDTVTFPSYSQGNSILTHYPIKRSHHIDLSYFGRQPRQAIYAEIELSNSQVVAVVNLHLGLAQKERDWQIKELLKVITECTLPLIVAGDFNDWRAKADKTLSQYPLLLAHEPDKPRALSKTFPAWWPMISLDRIYYHKLKLNSYRCVGGGARWGRSDHLPILAEFLTP